MKLESLAREDLDMCGIMYQMWLKMTNCSLRAYYLLRRIKWLDMAEKKFEQILFLKDIAPSLPSPCRVNITSTYGDEFSELEFIPSFFFKEVSTVLNSIPSAIGEEDDSLNFELLIPSFFFDEEEDLSDKVNFESKEVISSEINCEKIECSKEWVISHNKLISKNSFTFLLDDSRSIFDRGKYVVVHIIALEN
ncbi:hypothetical protein MKX03_001214 [Papaver bracteatum]|nr:hypothetical protein MKX03_001214 [Papaver bracteatum]